MGIKRFYTDAGMPAFVLVSKSVSGAQDATQSIVYAKAPEFIKLWNAAEAVPEQLVDKIGEVG